MNPKTALIAFAVFHRVGFFLMAFEGAQPAFLRTDHSNRFLCHGVGVFFGSFRKGRNLGNIASRCDFGPAFSQGRLGTKF